jgi:cytochrome c1
LPERTDEMFAQLSNYLKAVNAETLAERPPSKGKKNAKKKK